MNSMHQRRATAGFASGFMSVIALFGVLAALMTSLGPTESASSPVSHAQVGAGR
jgi:hypothetical protein